MELPRKYRGEKKQETETEDAGRGLMDAEDRKYMRL